MTESRGTAHPPRQQCTETATGKKLYRRRPHRKTKTGCQQCRESRIKCDDARPSCSYCIRHSKACSFLSAATESNEGLTEGSKTAEGSRAATSELGDSHEQALPVEYMQPSPYHPNLQMNDLELLHHYTASTYLTIVHGPPEHGHIWQIVIPQLALKHPFLMHGILAVAALHLAYLFPDRRNHYTILAENHESLALPPFLSEAMNVTQENCAAVFVFSKLAVIYAMSAPDSVGFLALPTPGEGGGLPLWITLIRGAISVVSSAKNLVEASPVAPLMMFHDVCNDVQRKVNESDDLQLVALLPLFSESSSTPPERIQELSIYRGVLAGLRNNFAESPAARTGTTFWPAGVTEEYVRFLGERRCEALILLAHQCVLLKRTEPRWYLDGLPERVMVSIHEIIPDELECWIQWPLQQVGLGSSIPM